MKKFKAKVKVEYEFEFELDESEWHKIKEHAQDLWETKCSLGFKEENYHDTNIEVEEI